MVRGRGGGSDGENGAQVCDVVIATEISSETHIRSLHVHASSRSFCFFSFSTHVRPTLQVDCST